MLRINLLTLPTLLILIFTFAIAPTYQYRFLQTTPNISQVSIIPLNTPTQFNQSYTTQKYFQTTVQSPSSTQVLLITVSSDIATYVRIYVSTSNSQYFTNNTWPNWAYYTQQCFYSSIDTCAIQMPNEQQLPNGQTQLIVYFTIVVRNDCSYILDVSLQNVYTIKPNLKYTVNFNKTQSALLQLPGSYFTNTDTSIQYQQIIINCIYASYHDIGQFKLIAKQNEYPNTDMYDNKIIKSKSLNAFTQILQLPPTKQINSSYYIIIQGQNSTKFNFTVHQIQSITSSTLYINQTIQYLTNKQITYSYSQQFNNTIFVTNISLIKPLIINIYSYRGNGKFNIDYCNNLYNYIFQSIGGQSGQIKITQSMRLDCYNVVSKQGGLLIQNLEIGIVDIVIQFGYGFGLYQGVYDGYLVPGIKQIGILQDINQIQTYNVQIYNRRSNITVTAQVYKGNITILIIQCQSSKPNTTNCTTINSLNLTQSINPIDKLSFFCPQKSTCKIQVNQTQPSSSKTTQSYAKYSLYMSYQQSTSTQLQPNIPQFDIVQMNQYNYYYINVTQLRNNPLYNFTNISTINIRNTVVNGQTVLLTSTSINTMKYDQLFKKQYDVLYGWQGTIQYIVNSTYPQCCIYIGILGDSQSIYHIQYTVNTSINIPAAYLDILQSTTNNYQISSNSPYILLKYKSHIIPYTITFNPTPSCIRYGNKLPLPTTCMSASQIPNIFTYDVIYFNITENLVVSGNVFKFSVYVSSGGYVVQSDRPVMIACQKACYQLVKVIIGEGKKQATIMHSGDGYMTLLDQQGKQIQKNKVSNGPLILTCSNAPCTYMLNATLRYYGDMEISFQQSYAAQITWRTKPTPLPSSPLTSSSSTAQPKLFYYPVPKYTQFTSLLFYSSAATLTIYYNIQSLNQTYTNTINYQYPNPSNSSTYIDISYGDPLSDIHIVDIEDQVIQGLGCKKSNIVCIVTVRVQLNQSIEYSRDYINTGLAYYSANLYQFQISQTYPIYRLKQSHSLSYFTHKIDFKFQHTSMPFIIHIQPISNCRPQIQTQGNNYMVNYYTDVKLKKIMPGQSTINYRILCDDNCMYSTTITNVDYQVLWPNVQARVRLNQNTNKVVLLYQHSLFSDQIRIQTGSTVSSIIIGKVSYNTSPQGQTTLIIPTIQNNLAYTQNTTTLTYKQTQIGQYLIVIQYLNKSSSSSKLLSVIVKVNNQPTILLHNQQEVYIYDPTDNSISAQNRQKFQYRYYSDTNFYIFVEVNRGAVSVKIRLADLYGAESYILNTTITNTSQPWILVTPKSTQSSSTSTTTDNIIHYLIQCQYTTTPASGSKSTFKIHIQQEGIKGLQQLYAGIVTYDAFVHDSGMNCYKYQTGLLLGLQVFQVDINFRVPIPQQIVNSTLLNIIGLAQLYPSSQYQHKLSQNTTKITPTTYRLILSYNVLSIYKICFITSSTQLVGIQYEIIINIPGMPMLYDNQYQDVKRNQIYGHNGQYTMFQYVNGWTDIRSIYGQKNQNDQQNNIYYGDNNVKNIVMNVVNCLGQSVLLGSSSYTDMLTGKLTTIPQTLSYASVTTALVPVPHGYYYFGVKSSLQAIPTTSPLQLFRVAIQPAPMYNNTAYIPEQYYVINWTIKASLYTEVKNNMEYVNIVVPTIVKAKGNNKTQNLNNGNGQQVIKIVYQLYLINILQTRNGKQIKYQYGIDAYTKCPGLFNLQNKNNPNSNVNPTSSFKPYQSITIQHPYNTTQSSSFKQTITFTLPITSFKIQSNISIKATVYIKSDTNLINTINYYYGQQQILVTDGGQGSSLWKPIKWIFFIITIILCTGGLALLWRFYKLRISRNISFQAADMTGGQEMQSRVRSNQTSPQRQVQRQRQPNLNESGVSSNRRPLNDSVGYGQFIDQVNV